MIRLARILSSHVALRSYLLVASLAAVVTTVSVSNVVQNFLSVAEGGPSGVGVFALSAVLKTQLLVQLALILGGFSLVSLVRQMTGSGNQTRLA